MKAPSSLHADINFLYEIGNIRLIARMGTRFLGAFKADLADHHFRVFWIAMVIAAREGDADTGKIAKLALLHDIAESRTGDVDYLARQYVIRNEELAIQDMLAGTALESEFYELWKEYEERRTLEARIVKDADNLDVDFELAERRAEGHGLPGEWDKELPSARGSQFFTQAAQQIYDELKTASPSSWHINGRNRVRAGDWQPKDAA